MGPFATRVAVAAACVATGTTIPCVGVEVGSVGSGRGVAAGFGVVVSKANGMLVAVGVPGRLKIAKTPTPRQAQSKTANAAIPPAIPSLGKPWREAAAVVAVCGVRSKSLCRVSA